MSEIVDRFRKEVTFFMFDGNTCAAKEFEYSANMFDVWPWRSQKYDCVVGLTTANCYLTARRVTSIMC